MTIPLYITTTYANVPERTFKYKVTRSQMMKKDIWVAGGGKNGKSKTGRVLEPDRLSAHLLHTLLTGSPPQGVALPSPSL